jgi:ligand-binding sensor domain-containing protein
LALIAITGLASIEPVRAFDWVSLTSFEDVRRMRVIDGSLHMVTSGGLLVVESADQPGSTYTNLNGLGTVDITDILQDGAGQIWVTGDGLLTRFNGSASSHYPIADNDGDPFRLYCLADDGDFLWLGSDAGLILFSKTADGGQIQDAFLLFDDLNPSPPVFDIELAGDSIMIATGAGLAVADRTSHFALKSPANWRGYEVGEYPEMGEDTVRTVRSHEGRTYIGNRYGLFRVDNVLDSLVALPFAVDTAVYRLEVEDDSLWIYSAVGLGVLLDDVPAAVATPGLPSAASTGTVYHSRRWVGLNTGGVYYRDGTDYQPYEYTGLPSNDLVDVAVTPGGQLSLLFRFEGLYLSEAGDWDYVPIYLRSRALSLVSDDDGSLYVGTFGGGMSRVNETVTRYSTVNSTFQEAGVVGSDYVVCFDVAVTENYFFGANFEPRDGTRVAIAELDRMDELSGWTSLGVQDGLNGAQMVSVDCYGSSFAIGSGLNGAFVYSYGADPFDKSDDNVIHYYYDNPDFRRRLVSDAVRTVRFSPEGNLWVGTAFGMSRFDPGLEMMIPVALPAGLGPDVTAMVFDSRGNAWIGAKNGLARLDGLTGEISVYTTRTSGLIDDYVTNLTFDNNSGNLYVATGSGLSIILSTIGLPTEDLDAVVAFPNPFVIESNDDRLNFNVAGNARLRIFTVSGELVVDLPRPVWDGRNDSGDPVASGVYLFVLTDEDGETGRGKFLLVRN